MTSGDPDGAVPALTVLRAGPLSTVQDLGRRRHRAFGVPIGGAFDPDAHAVADALVGNEPSSATVELTLLGGSVRAEVPLDLALAGAPMSAIRRGADGSDRALTPPVAFGLHAGDVLEIGGTAIGARAYLAVRGGWRTSVVLGSRSTEEPLRPGDSLPAVPSPPGPVRWPGPAMVGRFDPEAPIRLIDGPDCSMAINRDWHLGTFAVAAESDRMGLRLVGPEVAMASAADRRSVPVAPGGIQIAGGRPIVLGVACGTLGGYPLVAFVATADLGRLGQLRPGDQVRFHRIDLAEARRLDASRRARSRALRLQLAGAFPLRPEAIRDLTQSRRGEYKDC